MTLGDLSEDDVEGIRTGTIADPAVGQVAALAGAFGIEPAYLLDRGEAPLDGGLWRPCGTRRSGMRPGRSRTCPSGRGGWCWGSCGSSGPRSWGIRIG
jgi:hypothetical protein